MNHQGKLIVFEGIDGAGTTTQIEAYARYLREGAGPAKRRLVHVTSEPSSGPIGSLLRQILSGRVTLDGSIQAPAMALLFAADRLDHVSHQLEPFLREGAVVLCDRYDLSSLTYQTATAPAGAADVEDWVRSLNRFAVRPDATVVLDTSPGVAERRRRGRTGAPELYEVSELQVRLSALYRDAERLVPGDRIIHLDGDAAAGSVSQAVRAALDPLL